MNESTDDFKENIKLIKQKKQQSLLSKYFSSNSKCQTTNSELSRTNQYDENSFSIHLPITNNQNNSLNNKPKSKMISFSNLNHSIEIDKKETYCESLNENYNLKENTCPLCNLDLNTFDEFGKEKHVNNCLDNLSNKIATSSETFEPDLSETKNIIKYKTNSENKIIKCDNELVPKDIIPNCPICGKTLHSLNVIFYINI